MKNAWVRAGVFVLALCSISIADIINVPADQPTIQAGVDAASDYDTILVANGTYTGNGNVDIDFLGKSIVVKSANGPDNTIIDCNGSIYNYRRGFIFQNGETSDAVLDGFKIINGYVESSIRGGAIYITNSSSPTVKSCIFENDYSNNSGAVLIDSAEATITDCLFFANERSAVYCISSSVTLTNCVFDSNYVRYGASLYGETSTITVNNCDFLKNYSSLGYFNGYGSGVYAESCSITLEDCLFDGNTGADYGSAIYVIDNYVFQMNNCTITNNTSRHTGGAIYCSRSLVFNISNCRFENNVLEDYSGGAIYVTLESPSAGIIANCDFINNSCGSRGGGALCGGAETNEGLFITDCRFISNYDTGYYGDPSGGAISIGAATIENCEFINNSTTDNGGAIKCSSPIISNCIFYGNSAAEAGGAIYGSSTASPIISNCTFSNNSSINGSNLAFLATATPTIENCIIAFGNEGQGFLGGMPTIICTDIYGNEGGDWVGDIAHLFGVDGNFSLDPEFCDTSSNILFLTDNSPCLPGNNDCGVLIGAREASCSYFNDFSLISPPSDTVFLDLPIEFIWHKTVDADSGLDASHVLYIDNSYSFDSPDTFYVGQDTSFTVTGNLDQYGSNKYYWKVKAFNSYSRSLFSEETWNFYIVVNPSIPYIESPPSNAMAGDSTLLIWTQSYDPDPNDIITYTVQINDDYNFDTPLIDSSGIEDDTLEFGTVGIPLGYLPGVDSLESGTSYYWRVFAVDSYGLISGWDYERITYIDAIYVWPGDLDNNGIVEAEDIIPLAAYWNESGPARGNTDYSWSAHEADVWGIPYATFADANGNGLVEIQDFLPICINWNKSHSDTSPITFSADNFDIEENRVILETIFDQVKDSRYGPQAEIKNFLANLLSIELPLEFSLSQNYPNPFNSSTMINYTIPYTDQINLAIYNIIGQQVKVLADGLRQAGNYSVAWNGVDDSGNKTASGIYFIKLKTSDYSSVKMMTILK